MSADATGSGSQTTAHCGPVRLQSVCCYWSIERNLLLWPFARHFKKQPGSSRKQGEGTNVAAFAREVATIPPGRKGKKELIDHFVCLEKMGEKKQCLSGHTRHNSGDHLQGKKSQKQGKL